jgi:DNA polymerase-1
MRSVHKNLIDPKTYENWIQSYTLKNQWNPESRAFEDITVGVSGASAALLFKPINPVSEVGRVADTRTGVIALDADCGIKSGQDITEAQLFYFPNWIDILQGKATLPETLIELQDQINNRRDAALSSELRAIGDAYLLSCSEFYDWGKAYVDYQTMAIKETEAKPGGVRYDEVAERLFKMLNLTREDKLVQTFASNQAAAESANTAMATAIAKLAETQGQSTQWMQNALQDKSVGLVAEKGSRNQKEAKKLMREVAGDKCVLTKTGLEKYRDWWAGMVKAKQKPTEEQKLREKNRLFDQGYISLSRAECLVTKDKRLIAYAEYGQHQNLISKVKRLKTGGLPIQTSFESLLETGRISSFSSRILYNSAATLNLPRKPGMRECFVPRNYEMTIPEEDRNVLLFCDFGKAELVALSENMIKLFGHSALGDVLNAGKDPYIDFASSLLNMSYEEADKKKNTEEVAEKRQLSKAWVLGKPGGLGVEKFILWAKAVYNLNLGATPEEELERVKKYDAIFFQKYPEIRKYLKWIGELCKNDPQNLCDIKHIYFGHLRGRMQYTVAANSQMQTLTAYLFKLAVWETVRRCYVGKKVGGRLKTAQFEKTYLYGQRPVAPVHDELVVESKEKIAHEAGHELKEVMEGEANKILQYVKMTSELACARRWRKGAKPVYYKGRLQPVEDASMRALFEFFGRCAKKEMKP